METNKNTRSLCYYKTKEFMKLYNKKIINKSHGNKQNYQIKLKNASYESIKNIIKCIQITRILKRLYK